MTKRLTDIFGVFGMESNAHFLPPRDGCHAQQASEGHNSKIKGQSMDKDKGKPEKDDTFSAPWLTSAFGLASDDCQAHRCRLYNFRPSHCPDGCIGTVTYSPLSTPTSQRSETEGCQ